MKIVCFRNKVNTIVTLDGKVAIAGFYSVHLIRVISARMKETLIKPGSLKNVVSKASDTNHFVQLRAISLPQFSPNPKKAPIDIPY